MDKKKCSILHNYQEQSIVMRQQWKYKKQAGAELNQTQPQLGQEWLCFYWILGGPYLVNLRLKCSIFGVGMLLKSSFRNGNSLYVQKFCVALLSLSAYFVVLLGLFLAKICYFWLGVCYHLALKFGPFGIFSEMG